MVDRYVPGTARSGASGSPGDTTGPNATGPNATGPNATGPNATGPNATSRTAPAWLRTGRPALHRLMQSRRKALIALGGGAVALGGVGSTTAWLVGQPDTQRVANSGTGGGGVSPRDAGSFADRDASYVGGLLDTNDLGASGVADTPSQAAAAALKATPRFPTPLNRDPVLHLLRRLTFGPTQAEVTTVKQIGIDTWIDRQLEPDKIANGALDGALAAFPTLNLTTAQIRTSVKENDWQAMWELGRSTIARGVWSNRQLLEVMVEFWNNHLHITNPFDGGWDTRSPYDREVIRKHALGKFSDMLLASARHPAMMRYLDNTSSDKRNVNENYGRELLELHTVGIDGGYNESDVRNAAYLMTGRTATREGNFKYEANRHWTGAVKVLGFQHNNKSAADGLAVGDAFLTYLATHPSTARYIARKLAVRFVCDSPPQGLVDRLAKTYQESGTAIVPVLRVLFRSLEFWIATGLKTRRPLENFIATARVVGVRPGSDTAKAFEDMYNFTRRFGQPPMYWDPPNGFPDVAKAWSSAAGMLEIWNSHRAFVQGSWKGLATPKPEELMAQRPTTLAPYLDALADRLLFQPMKPADRDVLVKFLSAQDASRIGDGTLGGKLASLAPIVLDSVYHALR